MITNFYIQRSTKSTTVLTNVYQPYAHFENFGINNRKMYRNYRLKLAHVMSCWSANKPLPKMTRINPSSLASGPEEPTMARNRFQTLSCSEGCVRILGPFFSFIKMGPFLSVVSALARCKHGYHETQSNSSRGFIVHALRRCHRSCRGVGPGNNCSQHSQNIKLLACILDNLVLNNRQ